MILAKFSLGTMAAFFCRDIFQEYFDIKALLMTPMEFDHDT